VVPDCFLNRGHCWPWSCFKTNGVAIVGVVCRNRARIGAIGAYEEDLGLSPRPRSESGTHRPRGPGRVDSTRLDARGCSDLADRRVCAHDADDRREASWQRTGLS